MTAPLPMPIPSKPKIVSDSGKGCKSPGYDEFNPPSWPSECAPNKEDWIATGSAECRKPGAKYGNVFWQCSDIALVGCETLAFA